MHHGCSADRCRRFNAEHRHRPPREIRTVRSRSVTPCAISTR
jgi:hypothetical protein